MTALSAQRQIAEFAATAPQGWGVEAGAASVRRALLDTLAVSVAGARTTAARGAIGYVETAGGNGSAQPWLASRRCAVDAAAMIDAVMAHALDYDDVTPAWRGHPSAVMFPALFALGAHADATGDDVVQAYLIGFEAGALLGQALAGRHYEKGWHATATIGVIAAAVAGSRLIGLSAAATSDAIGLALAQAGGIQAAFASDAKPVQVGFAAAGAVRACLLAANGVGASDAMLDGAKGFVEIYAGGWSNREALSRLGVDPPQIVFARIEAKLHPICYAAHRAIEAALWLREHKRIDVGAITAIDIEGSPGAHTPLLRTLPSDAQAATFSVEYGVACALLDGAVTLRSFDAARFARAEIDRLMRACRVSETVSPSSLRRAVVRITLRDGRVHERAVTRAADGEPDPKVLMTKVVDCLDSVGVADESEALRALCTEGLTARVATLLDSGPIARIRERLSADHVH